MKAHDEATLIKALEFLCTNTSPTACARHIGYSPKIIWTWGAGSTQDAARHIPPSESKFGVRWPDPESEAVYFHDALTQARTIFFALASLEAAAMIGPDAGYRRVARDSAGRIQFKVDTRVASDAMTMDEWDWEQNYGTRDRKDIFERDENGCLIPDVYTEPLPAALKIHLLRSLLPSVFNAPDKTTSEVIHSGGVLIVGEHKPDKPRSALEEDLRERLARIREGVKKPNAPVQVMGRGESGPPENVSHPSDQTPADIRNHPRAYEVPALPAPKPQEPSDFRRPTRALNNEDRRSPMPSGGFSLTRGRPT